MKEEAPRRHSDTGKEISASDYRNAHVEIKRDGVPTRIGESETSRFPRVRSADELTGDQRVPDGIAAYKYEYYSNSE